MPARMELCGEWSYNETMSDPFWSQIYDNAKDRRYAKLFFVSILMAGGFAALVAALGQNLSADQWKDVSVALVPAMIAVTGFFIWRWYRCGRKQRAEQLKSAELSRDELAKARLKLKDKPKPMKGKPQRNSLKRTAPRALDTYLKY